MTGRIWSLLTCAALAIVLVACGPPSKSDIVSKAKDAKTRADLERVLGKADDVSKLGPIEKCTYKAKDGRVVFILVGDTVTIEKTGEPKN